LGFGVTLYFGFTAFDPAFGSSNRTFDFAYADAAAAPLRLISEL
jgi:hypothetical protein